MTDNSNAEMDSEFDNSMPQTEAPDPFLTVIARAPLVPADGLPEPLKELLGCTRTLLLFSAQQETTASNEAELQACLGEGATVVLLSECPEFATLAEEPGRWLEHALDSQRQRQDLGDPRTALLVTEGLELCVSDPQEPRGLKTLCDLHHDAFAAAWNLHLSQQSSTAGRPTIVAPDGSSTGTPTPTAQRVAELEQQVRELLHERQVLRENRDHALEEHREEIRAYQELNARNGEEFEAYHLELKVRAEKIDELHGLLASRPWRKGPPAPHQPVEEPQQSAPDSRKTSWFQRWNHWRNK